MENTSKAAKEIEPSAENRAASTTPTEKGKSKDNGVSLPLVEPEEIKAPVESPVARTTLANKGKDKDDDESLTLIELQNAISSIQTGEEVDKSTLPRTFLLTFNTKEKPSHHDETPTIKESPRASTLTARPNVGRSNPGSGGGMVNDTAPSEAGTAMTISRHVKAFTLDNQEIHTSRMRLRPTVRVLEGYATFLTLRRCHNGKCSYPLEQCYEKAKQAFRGLILELEGKKTAPKFSFATALCKGCGTRTCIACGQGATPYSTDIAEPRFHCAREATLYLWFSLCRFDIGELGLGEAGNGDEENREDVLLKTLAIASQVLDSSSSAWKEVKAFLQLSLLLDRVRCILDATIANHITSPSLLRVRCLTLVSRISENARLVELLLDERPDKRGSPGLEALSVRRDIAGNLDALSNPATSEKKPSILVSLEMCASVAKLYSVDLQSFGNQEASKPATMFKKFILEVCEAATHATGQVGADSGELVIKGKKRAGDSEPKDAKKLKRDRDL